MSSFELSGPIVDELRAARPRASEELRTRVAAMRPAEPRLSWPAGWRLRRVALVAVPACVVAGLGAAIVHGVIASGPPGSRAIGAEPQARNSTLEPGVTQGESKPVFSPHVVPFSQAQTLSHIGAPQLTPSETRLQDYRASLTIRVKGLDALSSSTQKAMRTARSLGGYVVSADFNAEKQGYSSLVFRVPITRIQQAIGKLSSLGTITAQDIHITDLQARFNRLAKQIDAISVGIAKIDDKLADPSLSNVDRVRLQQQRARLVSELKALTTAKGQTLRQARLATVSLSLTTQQAVVPTTPHHRGTLGRALDDAGTILAKELSWALYAVVVLGPFAVIALLVFLLVRFGRRYGDRRLLESS